MMSLKGVGIDMVEIRRFVPLAKQKEHRFLQANYTQAELAYCFSFKAAGPHLAGIFAAKEAVFKALGQSDLMQSRIEIRRTEQGQPVVWIANRRKKLLLVSISHTDKLAIAIAIRQ